VSPDKHFGAALIFSVFLLFCRIGGALMIAPGLGNTQIPMQVRAFVAIGVTLALSPVLLPHVVLGEPDPVAMAKLVVGELVAGAFIGVLARMFFAGLETLSYAAATFLGLANPFGVEMEASAALPPLATYLTLGATAMIFVADLHWQIIIGLIDSYRVAPLGSAFDARRSLAEIGQTLGQAFVVSARVASPFFLYSVIVNFAIALINRVTPQIAIFFIAPPFIISGGLAILYFAVRAQVAEFTAAFSAWLGII
jgi:flagellar biosynthetic protein FliR